MYGLINGLKFIDFYIKELNLAIEFDGSYWHRNDTENSIKERDNAIKEKIPLLEIYHIKEQDYINNKEYVINYIVSIIKEKYKEIKNG